MKSSEDRSGTSERLFILANETMKRLGREFGGRPGFARYRLLRLVADAGSGKMNGIARSLGISQATLSSAVDALVRQGLVVRAADPDDRRVVRLSLTEKGDAAYRRMTETRKLFLERLLGSLSPSDREELGRIADVLIRNLRSEGGASAASRP